MNKYNDMIDNINKQIKRMDINCAVNIGLTLCVQDIHYFSDYLKINQINENIFDVFEQVVFNIAKNRCEINKYDYRFDYKNCVEALDSFYEEENELYDECVNLCSEIIHLIELTLTNDVNHILSIIKLWYENQEAYIQKNYHDADNVTTQLIDNILRIDLLLFNI